MNQIYFLQYFSTGFTIVLLFIVIKNKIAYSIDNSMIKKKYIQYMASLIVIITFGIAILSFMSGYGFDDPYLLMLYIIMIIQLDYIHFRDKKF